MITRVDTLILEPDVRIKRQGAYLIEVVSSDTDRTSIFNAWTCTSSQYDSIYRDKPQQDSIGRAGGLCFVRNTSVSFWGTGRGGCESLESYAEAKRYAVNRTIWFLKNETVHEYKLAIIKADPRLTYLNDAEQKLVRGELPYDWEDWMA